MTQMLEWRVDFKFIRDNKVQNRKAFTLTFAKEANEAELRVRRAHPTERLEILSVTRVQR